MDTLSHGLWGIVAAKGANRKLKEPVSLKWGFFWGVFPDIAAFAPIFLYQLYRRFAGLPLTVHPPTGDIEPWTPGLGSVSDATQLLYSFTHSLIVFVIVVLLIYGVRKKIPWVLSGWLLHILFDIPSHSYAFYATPAFFPIFGWRFDGWAWGLHWWVNAINYGALLVVYLFLKFRKVRVDKVKSI